MLAVVLVEQRTAASVRLLFLFSWEACCLPSWCPASCKAKRCGSMGTTTGQRLLRTALGTVFMASALAAQGVLGHGLRTVLSIVVVVISIASVGLSHQGKGTQGGLARVGLPLVIAAAAVLPAFFRFGFFADTLAAVVQYWFGLSFAIAGITGYEG